VKIENVIKDELVTNELQPAVLESLPPEQVSVPWSLRDTVIGFGLFLVCMVGIGLTPLLLPDEGWVMSAYLLIYQPLQFIPILILLRMRRATPADMGLRRAQPNVLALGIGLAFLLLIVNVVNNLVMIALGVDVQAQEFSGLMSSLDQPVFLLITGILFAPLFEEMIFRGFLFGGLRQSMGWVKAAFISSAIFAAGHLSIAALIPTFALGFLFTYLYQKSNSIWPGIILHTLINSVSLCVLLVVTQQGIPLGF
jgi:membrane protease YdiL (CAAX protease family)